MLEKLKPGLRVNRHVRLVRPLSSGAMGSVWVGEHLNLDTLVAVKFISEEARFGSPDSARRFEVEAKANAQIKSPHVVQIFDHGVTEAGQPYIVMELLEGESLADRLERTGWLGFSEAGDVIRQMAAALTKAHGAGVIHRDIKPDNIFLSTAQDGVFVKLLDFGVAKNKKTMSVGMTSPGALVGTAEYISREQVLSAEEVDENADLWSLAVVAYEMLTGDVPFTGDTLGLICIAICNGTFTPPSTLRKGVPPAIDDWFERAFEPNAAARFSTAREMGNAFLEALQAFDSAPTSGEAAEPPPRENRRSRTSLGLGPRRSSVPGDEPDGAQRVTVDEAPLRRLSDPIEVAPPVPQPVVVPSSTVERQAPRGEPTVRMVSPQGEESSTSTGDVETDSAESFGRATFGDESPENERRRETAAIPLVSQRRRGLAVVALIFLASLALWLELRPDVARLTPVEIAIDPLPRGAVPEPPALPPGSGGSDTAEPAVDSVITPASARAVRSRTAPVEPAASEPVEAAAEKKFDARSDYGF